MKKILLVDDDDALRDQLSRALQRRGYAVRPAANARAALQLAQAETCDLAIIDLRMPGDSGMKLLADLQEFTPTTRVVILTGFGSIASAVGALKRGAVNYVAKPAHVDDILAAFETGARPASPAIDDEHEAVSLAKAEWEHIQRALAECQGNITQAARRLDISRRSLQRKLRKRAPE